MSSRFLTDPGCAPGGSNDVADTDAVNAIHARGAHAICYVDAGTDEPFGPDHQAYVDFDAACGGCLLGKPVGPLRGAVDTVPVSPRLPSPRAGC